MGEEPNEGERGSRLWVIRIPPAYQNVAGVLFGWFPPGEARP